MDLSVPLWLNTHFLEKALQSPETDEIISVQEKVITAVAEKGFTCDLYRVKVKYRRHHNNEEIEENKSIIIKAASTSDSARKDMVEKAGAFDTEIQMMTSTLKEMQLLLNDVKLSGDCFYTQNEDPALLVIQDLAALGFRMADRQEGLDLAHCRLAMQQIAKFHASSVAVSEKNPELKEKYNKGCFHLNSPSEMISIFNYMMKCLAEVVATWPEINQTCKDKMIKLSDFAFQRTALVRQPNESAFNVINHGDFWTNNMLFRNDEQGHPIEQIFVDFQYCVYASPALDIQYFLNTSPSEEVCINHTDELLNEYHQTLCETMEKLNCKTQVPTITALNGYMKDMEFYGLEAAGITLPNVLKPDNEELIVGELIGENGPGINKNVFNSPKYRNAMSRRLQYWSQTGLFDTF